MKKHLATKKTKPRSFDDIVANQDLWLPGLEYFFGRERGMHKLADYAKPCFEKLLMQWRKKAVDAINRATSDIQDQYNKALKDSRKEITVASAKAFLRALKYEFDTDLNKVSLMQTSTRSEGSRMASLYTTGTLVCHMFYPTNICCLEVR